MTGAMSSSELSFWGLVLTLMGLAMALWGLLLWFKPDSLRPDSYMYRHIYFRFFSWGRKAKGPVELTARQIRIYAFLVIVVGVIGVVICMPIAAR